MYRSADPLDGDWNERPRRSDAPGFVVTKAWARLLPGACLPPIEPEQGVPPLGGFLRLHQRTISIGFVFAGVTAQRTFVGH